MTIQQWVEKYLEDNGVFFDGDRAGIMGVLKAPGYFPDMDTRWGARFEGYPKQLYAVLLLYVRDAAVSWIDANKPQAFYRACFDGSLTAQEVTP